MSSVLPLPERTIVTALRRAVEHSPDRTFLACASGTRTYAQVNQRANAAAQGLAKLGLKRYGKVALMTRNRFEFVEGWLAAAKLGAIYVPINTEYKGEILAYQLNKADVTHLIIDVDLVQRLLPIMDRLPSLRSVISLPQESGAVPVGFPARCAVLSYGEITSGSAQDPDVAVTYSDPLAISFTSGTTGPSKGVLASHCHVLTFALDWIQACGFSRSDRLYTCLPMFHAIATWLGILPTLLQGAQAAFAERFSASGFWDDVRRYDASVVHGIFAMVPILLKQPARADDATVPARVFYIGQRNEEFEKRFNCRIIEVYGATETGIVTFTPLDADSVAGSCGRPNARTYDVSLVDANDGPVQDGEVGEIVVRPRQPYSMIQEYYGMPAETLVAFRNLWFHTGDNAKRDARGYFHFVDRKKDAIRRRGENISSFEIERALIADDRVAECAAVAVPSELAEDEIKMVVVPAQGVNLSALQVWQACEERMPRFWVPRYLEFRSSLPKTPNGKVQKYLLREAQGDAVVFDRLASAAALS